MVDDYVKRNVAQEHFRALLAKTFNVAIMQWNCSIVAAYSKAADVCGVCFCTANQWFYDYYVLLADLKLQLMTKI